MERFTLNAWDNIHEEHLLKVLIFRKNCKIMELVKQRMRRVKGSMMYRIINDEILILAAELNQLKNKQIKNKNEKN